MNTIDIICKFYNPDSLSYNILVKHSELVTQKAINIAQKVAHLKPDLEFIQEASMLHDIGIFKTHAPDIGCTGEYPYICHGYIGREILEQENLSIHALVCERHTGVGLSKKEIQDNNLPLPKRDMQPISIEEQIICFADKFFSKNPKHLSREKSVDQILDLLRPYGDHQVKKFMAWIDLFNYEY